MSDWTEKGQRQVMGRPDGVPLGRAFAIAPGLANEPLREAVDVVARVHGDGELPTIPIVWDSSLSVRARFMMRDGLPSAILARPRAAGLGLALIHGIAHYLDLCGVDRFGAFASVASAHTVGWASAVRATESYRGLLVAIDEAMIKVSPTEQPRRQRLVRLRSPEELWARAYTQYVVRRSRSETLSQALAAERNRVIGGAAFPFHWSDDEFGPIDDEIERLFRRLGWRRS